MFHGLRDSVVTDLQDLSRRLFAAADHCGPIPTSGRTQGLGASAIAHQLKIGRASVYRALEEA